jgi:hypothetical protein
VGKILYFVIAALVNFVCSAGKDIAFSGQNLLHDTHPTAQFSPLTTMNFSLDFDHPKTLAPQLTKQSPQSVHFE